MACENERDGNLVLAREQGLGEISICTCGVLQMTLGAVTLRLAPEAFVQMLRMCMEAAHSPLVRPAPVPVGGESSVH
ncbi:hypothetical protein [Acidipila sp. EB88]|uniref:hypothetical protein n=1 Tax=Acidipila sp. EB88 TaxID=2305226 RepID=UPI000F5D6CEB|nr:hypothetical protein [Acidipila sp. EB88]RRA48905.1 hypothetical protein D1Y84_12065 [Acidipila sp. EB88]